MGNKKVISRDNQDFTKEFVKGTEKILRITKVIGKKSNTTV